MTSPQTPERIIDATDLRILELLQQNGRLAGAEVARRLDLAPSATHQRIRQLEESGVVQGYVARIEPRTVDRGLLAFVHLGTGDDLGDPSLAHQLAALPGVLEVHDVAGDDGYLIKVRVRDPDALHALLHEGFGSIPGVHSTRTTIVLKTYAERVELPLPSAPPTRQTKKSS